MKLSRWLIVVSIVLILMVAGALVYMTNNASADAQKITSGTVATAGKYSSYNVQITYNNAHNVATITTNGRRAGDIKMGNYGYVRILKQTRDFAYLSVAPDGIGGYIIYDQSYPVYRLSLAANTLAKSADYGIEISSSEKFIAGVKINSASRAITLKDMGTRKIKDFPIEKKYGQCGDIKISPNETKLAYAAAVGNSDSERGDIFIVDIATGTQTKVNKTEIVGHAPKISSWIDNVSIQSSDGILASPAGDSLTTDSNGIKIGTVTIDNEAIAKLQAAVDGGSQPWRLEPLDTAKAEALTYGFTSTDANTFVIASQAASAGMAEVTAIHNSKNYTISLIKPVPGDGKIWTISAIRAN